MADYSSLSVEELVQELQQKDDAVRMAAEFGQQILAQLQEAQQKQNALASENEDLKIRVRLVPLVLPPVPLVTWHGQETDTRRTLGDDDDNPKIFSLNGQVESLTAANEGLEKKVEDLQAKAAAQPEGQSEEEFSTLTSV